MSNGAGHDPAGEEATTAQTATDISADAAPTGKRRASLKSPQSLERLRDRVQGAVRELDRLRKENAALSARIEDLEKRPTLDMDSTMLSFDENPDALREKVEGFIEAIDKFLARDAK